MPQPSTSLVLDLAKQQLAQAGIVLHVTKKRVKNINFRLKPYALMVSVPMSISASQIAQAVDKRVSWALDHHPQVLARYHHKQTPKPEASSVDSPVSLWGIVQSFTLSHDEKMAYYRQQLTEVNPSLFDKWQPIVGATANEVRLKKMHTRWGSCNTRARRIWLSVYLPAYPIECTEYVIVHELCHLHHANHSKAFWQTVAAAMPDYQQWHNMLAGKTGQLD
ncbi:M48 family metallopeptidase [Psychrobacter okhotskensis]|uniref:M48 family metallopeptidase n=1 Tax=Psychrobacter okhotskensis TaxID=212403 RepID=UPI00191AB88F|nr:M48 family metallopeptidase [Psychrobacter okhotskensis]